LSTYDAAGNLLTVTDPNQNVTSYQYDALNRKTMEVDADPDGGGAQVSPTTAYSYDAAGNLTKVVGPDVGSGGGVIHPTVSYAYDALNRKTQEIDANPGGGAAQPTLSTFMMGGESDENNRCPRLRYALSICALNRQTLEIDADPGRWRQPALAIDGICV